METRGESACLLMLVTNIYAMLCYTLLYRAIKCYKSSHITCYCRSSDREAIGNLKGCEASRSQQGYAQAYAANGFFITLLGGARCMGAVVRGGGEDSLRRCASIARRVCFGELGFVFK